MDICTYWMGGDLRLVDRMCLASMVMTGPRVRLYTHGEVNNAPAGVEICDAEPVLPRTAFLRVNPRYPIIENHLSILQFSDLFRIALMRQSKGFWLDTDVYMFKPFAPDPANFYLAHEGKGRLGVSAMYFPADNPVVAEFCEWLDGDAAIPPWLGFRRGVLRPFLYRLRGKPFTCLEAGITIFGNDGISRLARKHGYFDKAAPKSDFYLWTGREVDRFYEPGSDTAFFGQPGVIGFHVHRKGRASAPPLPGSAFEQALARVRHLL
jgi:hypothetical protein